MASIKPDVTLKQFQEFVDEVYGITNIREFSFTEVLNNMQRFAMRALKGIRKKDTERSKKNLVLSVSWSISALNMLHIDLDDAMWNRFPYLCSYCGSCPCKCKVEKSETRKTPVGDNSKKPKTLEEYQQMFEKIYPADKRTLEDAGIHLAEEIGELNEAINTYQGTHQKEIFQDVIDEFADVISCMLSVANSLKISVAKELAKIYYENCHVCHKAPCECQYKFVREYRS